MCSSIFNSCFLFFWLANVCWPDLYPTSKCQQQRERQKPKKRKKKETSGFHPKISFVKNVPFFGCRMWGQIVTHVLRLPIELDIHGCQLLAPFEHEELISHFLAPTKTFFYFFSSLFSRTCQTNHLLHSVEAKKLWKYSASFDYLHIKVVVRILA